jgi:hypothetical protein
MSLQVTPSLPANEYWAALDAYGPNRYRSVMTAGLVPASLVTCTSTTPSGSAGVVAMIWVSDMTRKLVAGSDPNVTPVANASPSPTTSTSSPPRVLPKVGLTSVTAGAEGARQKFSASV